MYLKLALLSGILLHFVYREYLIRKGPTLKRRTWRAVDFLVFTALPILQLWFSDAGKISFLDTAAVRSLGHLLFLLGLLLSIWGKYSLGKYWHTGWEYQTSPEHKLVRNGAFHFFKHPIYLGLVLLMTGFQLALANFLILLVLTVVAPVLYWQAKREERQLERYFGKQYIEFKNERIV